MSLLGGTGIPAAADRISGLGSMMWEYTLDYVELLDKRRKRRLQALSSPAELARLQERVREKSVVADGAQPDRTPLNPRHVGTLEGPGFAIEKLIFESRPRFYVAANLYRPADRTGPLPAVLFSPGSEPEGKSAEPVQRFCARMARSGFAALTWDPITVGERPQMWDPGAKACRVGGAARERRVLGRQCYLLGLNLMHYGVWDALRAIDYLQTRPDIDPRRIAMAGSSRGGDETLRTAALDPRIQAVVCISAASTVRHKTAARLAGDPERIYYGTLQAGIDHPELLAALAPRQLMIASPAEYFLPIEGARETFREVSRMYSLFGVGDRLMFVETGGFHALNPELRQAAAGWLVSRLGRDGQGLAEEPKGVFKAEELDCTPTGNVADLPDAKTVLSINRERAREITPEYSLPNNRHSLEIYRNQVRNKVRRVTQVGRFRGEAGILVPDRVHDVGAFARGVAFVCADRGKDDPAVRRGVIDPLMAAGYRVVALDVRGWGESEPHLPGADPPYSWEDFFAYRGIETGRPLLGQRMKDLLASARDRGGRLPWLLAGIGAGALVASHAAVLDRRIRRLVAVGGPLSFRQLADDPLTKHPFSSFLPGVIGEYDLHDVYASLAPREVLVLNPQDSQGALAPHEEIDAEFNWTRRVYEIAGAGGSFSIETGLDAEKMRRLLGQWLKS